MCGLYAWVAKDGRPVHGAIGVTLEALERMLHRAGDVDGEGDGCGLMVDIPRELWAEVVRAKGHASDLVRDPSFAVAHVLIPRNAATVKGPARELMSRLGLRVLAEREDAVDSTALGPQAREGEPLFWQVGGLIGEPARCFELVALLEEQLDLHVASCSTETVVYKALGTPAVLGGYYRDLSDPRVTSRAVLGHIRYSTNTLPSFRRVQPFGVLGHNGEINTIERLRAEARMLGIPLAAGASDSQDLSRTAEALVHRHGLTLGEAIELLMPPIVNEIKGMPEDLRGVYMYLRQAFGPMAQGPAALIARAGGECVFGVDALGLRPLWQLETADAHVFSSEPGVVATEDLTGEPKPLAPGEQVLVVLERDRSLVVGHTQLQRLSLERWRARVGDAAAFAEAIPTGGPLEGQDVPGYTSAGPSEPVKVEERVLGGFGWHREDMRLVQQMAATGAEPIGSLGYDGPLACLSPERQNLADYFKESVAVVTNPAIDREREVEHFSCRAVFGPRPGLDRVPEQRTTVETAFPVILGGHDGLAPLGDSVYRAVAREHKTYLLEDLWEEFRGRASVIDLSCLEVEGTAGATERLKQEAVAAVRAGAELLVLSDRTAFEGDRRYLDPHLALAAVDLALREHFVEPGEVNLRRRCGIVLRSSALRNLHDTVLALGLGADGVCPYTMVEVGLMDDYRRDVSNLCAALRKGIEKVVSTIGIHELRGYARLFASIGLKPELTAIFGTPAYGASDLAGTGFRELDRDGDERRRILSGADEARPGKTIRFYPKVYKAAVAAASGAASYEDYSLRVRQLEAEAPVSLRHLLELRPAAVPAATASAAVGVHSYPIVISSMSFGSQGEVAYRAYAEAAKRANIVAINGEGGELPDLYGRYPLWRGQQVASGRFGVTGALVNSSYLVEIKIGQGAKPGEGGHLPARKVTARVAQARNATEGTDLISPSNNHDLYSIEDLAQLIDELKTANPDVRVSVKVPVVPNIGTIAVGIAKAGADVITLSGFDGGTGAARSHALRHVGLPSDIGTRAVHVALMEAGLRGRLEIWADGGFRHGHDVVKLLCLGANRVGFGTLAMVSLGCTICRGCQLDTCHVGIATQIGSREEAQLKGLKKFTPQELDTAVEHCARFFSAMGDEVAELSAALGFERAQDLVGRSDLLVQARGTERVDVHELIRPLEQMLDLEPLDLPAPDERELVAARPVRMAAVAHAPKPTRVAAVAGQGLAAFGAEGVDIALEGGGQDGVAKGLFGGKVAVLKGVDRLGRRVNGSVGKSFAYGAQRGSLFVQGDADSRFGIRLSGADVVAGGEPAQPLDDSLGRLADRANLKGFAFEYMTAGRAVVLGDPGPWFCAGQTGGRVYLRVNPAWNLDRPALERRLGKGARVALLELDDTGCADVADLLGAYAAELRASGQDEEAERVLALAGRPAEHFLMSIPEREQTDPSVSTE
jgi:glutamate synthase (NADPH/NADH) large chain